MRTSRALRKNPPDDGPATIRAWQIFARGSASRLPPFERESGQLPRRQGAKRSIDRCGSVAAPTPVGHFQ
jgi:hypothetical protein